MSMMKVYFQAITVYKNVLKNAEMWGQWHNFSCSFNATPKMQISVLEEHNGSTKSDHKLISKMKQSNSFSAFPLGFVLRGYCLKVKSSTCTFT